jgi:hypothetical protein
MEMLLENKTTVIYWAGGAIGDAGDRAFARGRKNITPITKARGQLNGIQTRGKQNEPSDSDVAS